MKILVVEDELKTSKFLKKGLSEAGYVVDVAADGLEGLYLDRASPLEVEIGDRLQGTVGAGREGENKQDEQDRAQSEGQLMQGAEHGCFPVLMFLGRRAGF